MKEHGCKPREYDPSLRNNSHYCAGWKKIWAEYPQRKHEYSCQDCLNKLWQKVNCNLIYLETWASEQVQEIARTKQILEQIKARLDQLTASGQFHNCGIKKCCVEHDRPDHSENEERDLITTGSSEEFPKPKKTTFNRQDLLNWMEKMKIKKISLDPTTNQLSIEYKNDQISNWSPDDFPNEWGRFLKQEVSRNPVYLNQSTNRDDQNRWPVGEIAVGASIVIGLFSVIGILVYRWNKKK